jgi:16S rRNA processing protein RimM
MTNNSKKPTRAAKPMGATYQHRNEPVFVPDGYIAVGRVTAPHSLRGEVRVEPHTDFPERFTPGTTVFVGADLQKVTVESARAHKNQILLQLAGVQDRNGAESLRGAWLFVEEADAAALEDDTYWVHDIIGLMVQTETGEPLGKITDVLFTGANDVYVITGTDDTGNAREVLLPAIADVVQEVDLAEQRMVVRLLPGLL